jgi:hypothetical protein
MPFSLASCKCDTDDLEPYRNGIASGGETSNALVPKSADGQIVTAALLLRIAVKSLARGAAKSAGITQSLSKPLAFAVIAE